MKKGICRHLKRIYIDGDNTDCRCMKQGCKAETKKLEAQFKLEVAQGKGNLTQRITSYTGRYYAQVGPLLKKAKEYQNAIELLG